MSDPRRDPVELRRATVTAVDFEHRIITTIAVPYDEEAFINYRGQDMRESFDPGAFHGIETRNNDVTVNRDHDPGRTIGKVVSYRTDDPAGLITDTYISRTPLGDESLQLADDGILKASVGFSVRPSDQVVRGGLRRCFQTRRTRGQGCLPFDRSRSPR
jgi:phage head maturation protease